MAHKTTLWGVFGIVAVGVAGAGCQPTARLKAITAGYAPCRAAEIVIANDAYDDGFGEWDAWCGNEQWHCGGAGTVINCHRAGNTLHSVGTVPSQEKPGAQPISSTPEPRPTKSNWVTYESDACGVSARFPQEPAISSNEQAATASVTLLEQAVYDKSDGSGTMGLGCANLPKANASSARLLDGARNGMILGAKGKLLSERPIIGGREVHFRAEDHDGVARIFIAGDKILVALVHPLDAFPEKSTRRFFDSVRSL